MRLSRPMATWAMASTQSRGRLAARNPAVEQVDLRRDLREQRIERLVEQLEPRHLGVVQIDDHAGALGGVDARLAQCILQALRLIGLGRFGRRLILTSPHTDNLANDRRRRKANRPQSEQPVVSDRYFGTTPCGRAQPRPSSVRPRGRYSAPT